ncbi:MAG: DUF5067 domain-containing protein, partial [Bacteroidales bacterium]|nr:DUF5067 domain-containing protein [Bacteroidales bacterium]
MEGEKRQVKRKKKASTETRGRRRKSNKKGIYIAVLCVEAIVLCLVLYSLIHFSIKLKNKDFSDGSAGAKAQSEEGASSGSVNVDNDNFTLTCKKVQLTTDVDGNPAALIFFTFVNKTDAPLSMSEVFPPKVVQDGVECETVADVPEPPEEYYNRDTQIQGGASIEACYSVKLQNVTSELTLTIHDNYETFADIGSTV